MKTVTMLYGKEGMKLRVPDAAEVLQTPHVPAIAQPDKAVREALANPIGSPSLAELIARRKPQTVAITISDITRPVPNKEFLPAILDVLGECGIAGSQIVIIIGTGLHRPSTPEERQIMLGQQVLSRVEVIDHRANAPDTLVEVSKNPLVAVCRRFAQADFRIVTGYIEPHFMAGYSGGRKGVCPALVDLRTVQRFHSYQTLADPRADNGVLDGNPCHEISLEVARKVGVDFLFNVAITADRRIAGVYCGDLEKAHRAGCRDVARWTSAKVGGPYELVITSGGGFPLDQTFYQISKGMCTAMPSLSAQTTLLQVSACNEGIGSPEFTQIMLRWGNDWRGFLAHLAAQKATQLDQWGFQMQCRVLQRVGLERLWFACDGIPLDVQGKIGVTPLPGEGDAASRAQRAIDDFVKNRPGSRVAVIPAGPYVMLHAAS